MKTNVCTSPNGFGLADCPFCKNGLPQVHSHGGDGFVVKDTNWFQVSCLSCGASGPEATGEAEAVNQWNACKRPGWWKAPRICPGPGLYFYRHGGSHVPTVIQINDEHNITRLGYMMPAEWYELAAHLGAEICRIPIPRGPALGEPTNGDDQ